MQVGLLNGAPKHDLLGVIDRINSLSQKVRRESGKVIWIRHCGNAGDGFERRTPGWDFLPELDRRPEDLVVEKTLNDPYVGTLLADTLAQMQPRRVLVAGWATDFCVDATVRSSVSHDHHVVAVSDAHTLSDRPHLPLLPSSLITTGCGTASSPIVLSALRQRATYSRKRSALEAAQDSNVLKAEQNAHASLN